MLPSTLILQLSLALIDMLPSTPITACLRTEGFYGNLGYTSLLMIYNMHRRGDVSY